MASSATRPGRHGRQLPGRGRRPCSRQGELAVDAWRCADAPQHMGAARRRWTAQLVELPKMIGVEAVVVCGPGWLRRPAPSAPTRGAWS
jgi:hypothetical protein